MNVEELRKEIEKSRWKNKNEKYLFEIQKFFDLAENIDDEILRKQLIWQMLRCDKILTKIAEEVIENK